MGSNAASDGISECRAKSQTLSVHRAKQPVRGRHAFQISLSRVGQQNPAKSWEDLKPQILNRIGDGLPLSAAVLSKDVKILSVLQCIRSCKGRHRKKRVIFSGTLIVCIRR